jgi:hypothetical protein
MLAARIAEAALLLRQQRFDPLPQRVRHLPRLALIDILPRLTTDADGFR